MASGLVLIDKPQGITSFDVVAKLRKKLNTRKIGHAGTLDPMATGLMILGVNQGTKLLQFLIGMDKQYHATIRLGASTVTDDAEGEIVNEADASGITASQVDREISKLTGSISQTPSSVSAKKIEGKRAYELVREGVDVQLKPKEVLISRFDRVSEPKVSGGYVDFDVVVDCSSGTYIRALARDIGLALGVGGHLTTLRRTRIGPYALNEAFELGGDFQLTSTLDAAKGLFPPLEITSEQAEAIRHGKPLELQSSEEALALSLRGELVAIAALADGVYKSKIVISEPS